MWRKFFFHKLIDLGIYFHQISKFCVRLRAMFDEVRLLLNFFLSPPFDEAPVFNIFIQYINILMSTVAILNTLIIVNTYFALVTIKLFIIFFFCLDNQSLYCLWVCL